MESLRDRYPLENIKPLKKTIQKTFSRVILIVFVFLVFVFQIGSSDGFTNSVFQYVIIVGIILIVGIFTLTYVYEVCYLRYYFYDVDKNLIVIRKGVFSRNEISVPFNRLQDVYVDQDILDRIFGLYDVHVSSATVTSGFLSHIDGLNKQNAEEIKKILLKGIHKK